MTQRQTVTLRQYLLIAAMTLAGCFSLLHSTVMLKDFGPGWDAYAYHHAWQGDMYDSSPGRWGAYNYSPVFAQLLWPLTHLPWPLFAGLLIGGATLGLLWLVSGMRLVPAALLLMICSVQVLSGNIDWLLAVLTVLGMRHGGVWTLAAITKVTPTMGPVWFAARGEWRQSARFATTLFACVGVSVLVSPDLWIQWTRFLIDHAASRPGMVSTLTPPLGVRLVIAVTLTVVAARLDRPWWLPVAMLVAVPVPGTGPWALLAAMPRLHRDAVERRNLVVSERGSPPAQTRIAETDEESPA